MIYKYLRSAIRHFGSLEVRFDDEMNSIHFVFSGDTNLTFMETQPFEGCQSSFTVSGRTQ